MSALRKYMNGLTVEDFTKHSGLGSSLEVIVEYLNENEKKIEKIPLRKGDTLYFGADHVKLNKHPDKMVSSLKKSVMTRDKDGVMEFVVGYLGAISIVITLDDLATQGMLDRIVDGKATKSRKIKERTIADINRGLAVLDRMLTGD